MMAKFQIKLIVIYLNLYKPVLCNWLRLSQADLQLHLHLDSSSLGAWSVNNNIYLCINVYISWGQ